MKRIHLIERSDVDQLVEDKLRSMLESDEFRTLLIETITPEFMGAKEATAYLCISKSTLNRLVNNRLIHAHQVSENKVVYKRSELREYLELVRK